MNDLPEAKIRMMKSSIYCLVFGLLGLLPFIGVPFALAALWASYTARRQEMKFWNPAKPQRVAGFICASFGALIWSLIDTVVIYESFNRYCNE